MTTGLLLSNDLFFTSKVTGTARQLGLQVDLVTTPVAAMQRLEGNNAEGTSQCVVLFVDLGHLAVDLVALVAAAHCRTPPVRVIAFGAHVATDRLAAAREAGCDEVMPRGRFSAQLVEILTTAFGSPNQPASTEQSARPAEGESAQ